ncbi:MAG TPA: alpha/beta hydrolase, partial [Polyangiaceae bacterium]|nr:alpha/beta hydrolase [Polyangiaceae bacterium]
MSNLWIPSRPKFPGQITDGSSWSKVISLLLAKGYGVKAIEMPLTSFEEDWAAVKGAIGAQEGPVLLVGHSYGGVVITKAGNDPKVQGLVYGAAFAPDANQSIDDMSKGLPPGRAEITSTPDGSLLLSAKGIREDFVQDLTADEQARLIATQRKTSPKSLDGKP